MSINKGGLPGLSFGLTATTADAKTTRSNDPGVQVASLITGLTVRPLTVGLRALKQF